MPDQDAGMAARAWLRLLRAQDRDAYLDLIRQEAKSAGLRVLTAEQAGTLTCRTKDFGHEDAVLLEGCWLRRDVLNALRGEKPGEEATRP